MSLNFLSQLTGSFSQPCAENPTVAMVEAAYRHHELDWRYINCEVAPADLAAAVSGAKAMGWAGFNCSLPHKVDVIQHLDSLAESAKIIGAVNCVVITKEKNATTLRGENTDGKGFVQSLEGLIDPQGKSMVLFGAGGAARAIGVEMALAGIKNIRLVNRSRERGEELAKLLNEKTDAATSFEIWDQDYSVPAETDIVVNATSIGLFPDVDARLAIDMSTITSKMLVADVIPNPPRTRLITDAQAIGCTVVDGLGMLVNQGVIGIKLWTGMDVEPAVMRKRLEEIFGT